MDNFYDHEFETWAKTSPTSFRAGCFHITRLKNMRMALSHRKESQYADTIYLFGHKRTRDVESPQIFLHSYHLPSGRKMYQKELGFYNKQRRAFRLDGGITFDSGLLNIEQVAPAYIHKAFRTRDGRSRRRIVHVYETEDRAAIVVFSLNSARFASNTFFQTLAGSLKIQ